MDASVWVSAIISVDKHHQIARSWIDMYVNGGGSFVAPALLAVETAAAVSRVLGNAAAARNAAHYLYISPLVRLEPLSDNVVGEAVDLSASRALRGADAIYVAVARQLGIPLVTLDQEQISRSAGIIATIRP
jgi:predicted nucleic acid-binding protein